MLPVTKREIILLAYEDLALAGYEFDLSPEEIAYALRRLELMAAAWQTRGAGISLSAGGLDDPSGVPAGYVEGVAANLAMRIASGKGKQVAADTRAVAAQARDIIFRDGAIPQTDMQSEYMPRGAGNRGEWQDRDTAFFPGTLAGPIDNLIGP